MKTETKTKFVAVEYNDSGTCKKVLQVFNLTESEYNKLLKESLISKQHGRDKSNSIDNSIKANAKKIDKNCLLIAKGLYDNFVDRGLIEDSDEFQQNWYNHIFNEEELDISLFPEDFKKIFNYVKGDK